MPSILVVDDDGDARDALTQYLSRIGLTAEGAPNGREALDIILRRTPDLVVLDLRMPEMDGASLLDVLRSYLRLQNLPVVIWTAVPDSPIMDRARRMKVDALLVKTQVSLEEIGQVIQHQLMLHSHVPGAFGQSPPDLFGNLPA
jgi:CheY-like chemotaxis protein